MNTGKIEFFPTAASPLAQGVIRFSILIPTWNNLAHLELCLKSIEKNSRYEHQLIIHVNEGADGTLEWVRNKKLDHSWSNSNVGVCYAFNAAASLAKSEYLLMLDDDNYMLPDWDHWLIEEIKKIGHPYFAVSATKIERFKTFNPCVISPVNFGTGIEDFDEEALLSEYLSYEKKDWSGSSWYPMVIHRKVWDLVGGMSIEFSPGMYSDPDFMMKLWNAGVRYFVGVSAARCYHFMSKSVRRIKKNKGRKQFLNKWGISNSTFRKYYLRLGDEFTGPQTDPSDSKILKIRRMRDKLKRLFFT